MNIGVIAGFDWDESNREKCCEHGVSLAEIESLFNGTVIVLPDSAHSRTERRFHAVGQTAAGRHVFVAATVRAKGGKNYIRPISARYMHRKEIIHYEKQTEEAPST